jgi:K(+)-stimulated pyrophosphate-energized sodium pump
MGADLFESYVGSIIAAMAIAVGSAAIVVSDVGNAYLVLPLALAATGIVASILGTFAVRTSEQATFSNLLWALRRGIFAAAILVAVAAWFLVQSLNVDVHIYWAIIVGLASGVVIGLVTEFFTSYDYFPTKRIAESAQTGPATVIIAGIATGMQSTLVPTFVVVLAIIAGFTLGAEVGPGMGFYGVAIAAVGMLSTLGITLATDAYGPVADNAGGIAEQAHRPSEVRDRTDALDALGNTTAATGKGFAIGSAALTALALMAAYSQAADLEIINLLEYNTLAGALIGAMLPFIFCALTMQAVGRAAYAIVNEVRRQFREIPGIMDGTTKPEYALCVDLSTRGALREMILPGVMAVAAPILVGLFLGAEALGGLLIGAIITGFLVAITMANAGGAWDNAKKFIERGEYGGKGSESHKAAVVGDTVGDPFKDTSGPSLNILLKLMSIVALVFAPLFS